MKHKHALGLPESDHDYNKRMLKQVCAYNKTSKPLFSFGLINREGQKLFENEHKFSNVSLV